MNSDDFPIEHFGKSHWDIFGRLAYVIPNLIVEGADVGWRAEQLSDVVAGRKTDFDLIELFRTRKIAADGFVGRAPGCRQRSGNADGGK